MNKQTLVITGSTNGIGLGLATEFTRLGHQVVINSRSEERVSRTVEELAKINPEVAGVPGSVSDEKTHAEIIKQCLAKFGKIDIWINNAGIPQPYQQFTDLENAELKQLLDINIYGLLLGSRIAAKQMIIQGYGKIFNMEGFGSDGRIMNKLSLYGTSKRAVNYFTKAFAREMKEGPVQIGILSPGMVRTDFLESPMKSASDEEIRKFKKVHAILAEDVDVVVKFLVPKILKSSKNYERIEYLSKARLMAKLIKMAFR